MPRLFLTLLPPLLIASSASAVTMDWTLVGSPGNAAYDSGGFFVGGVDNAYQIGTYEVTNSQYAEFLNAKAASDPLALYNTEMGNPGPESVFGGISRTGSPGSFTYQAIAGRENMPVNFVSFYDGLRFANWMHNGQGTGDTETGAYTLLGGTPTPSNGLDVTRNPAATIVLTSDDEWFKAAYHNAIGLAATDYFTYPAGSDTQPTCSMPTATPNRANCQGAALDNLTPVGSYTGSASPYGTLDQGGNVWEWAELGIGVGPDGARLRGGYFLGSAIDMAAPQTTGTSKAHEDFFIGFRLAMVEPIPEPSPGLLVIAGLLVLAGWRRSLA